MQRSLFSSPRERSSLVQELTREAIQAASAAAADSSAGSVAQHQLPGQIQRTFKVLLRSSEIKPSGQHFLKGESQHGRGWQGPLWVTQSNPLPKQGHPEQAAGSRELFSRSLRGKQRPITTENFPLCLRKSPRGAQSALLQPL